MIAKPSPRRSAAPSGRPSRSPIAARTPLTTRPTAEAPSSITSVTGNSKATLSRNVLRVIPLGGLEEVGANMMAYEYENDIIIVDCGFAFPDETTPGIDYIIPET